MGAGRRHRPDRARTRCATATAHYPYRFDSYFYYLTGFPEPEAVLVLVAGAAAAEPSCSAARRISEREIWDGFRYGPEAAREAFGFDEAYSDRAAR